MGRQPLWPALLHGAQSDDTPTGLWAPADCYLRCLMQQGTVQGMLGVPSEALLAFKEGAMLVREPACSSAPVV